MPWARLKHCQPVADCGSPVVIVLLNTLHEGASVLSLAHLPMAFSTQSPETWNRAPRRTRHGALLHRREARYLVGRWISGYTGMAMNYSDGDLAAVHDT